MNINNYPVLKTALDFSGLENAGRSLGTELSNTGSFLKDSIQSKLNGIQPNSFLGGMVHPQQFATNLENQSPWARTMSMLKNPIGGIEATGVEAGRLGQSAVNNAEAKGTNSFMQDRLQNQLYNGR